MAAIKAEKKERKKPVRRTPEEKAQQALDVVERKLARATARLAKAEAEAAEAAEEVQELERERDYAASHPALLEQGQQINDLRDALTS